MRMFQQQQDEKDANLLEQAQKDWMQFVLRDSVNKCEINVSNDNDKKLGMTLKSIALGIFVKHIHPESEAAICGILPGSVLVRLNGKSVATDPLAMKRILEHEEQSEEVVGLEFVYKNESYESILLCSSASWGIHWAQIGKFCHVTSLSQSGLAYQAGLSSAEQAAHHKLLLLSCSSSSAASGRKQLFLPPKRIKVLLEELCANKQRITLTYCYLPNTSANANANANQQQQHSKNSIYHQFRNLQCRSGHTKEEEYVLHATRRRSSLASNVHQQPQKNGSSLKEHHQRNGRDGVMSYWNVLADLHHAVSYCAYDYNEYELTSSCYYAKLYSSSYSRSTQQQILSQQIIFHLKSSTNGLRICNTLLLQILDTIVRYGTNITIIEQQKQQQQSQTNVKQNKYTNKVLLWSEQVMLELSDVLIFQATLDHILAIRAHFLIQAYVGILTGLDKDCTKVQPHTTTGDTNNQCGGGVIPSTLRKKQQQQNNNVPTTSTGSQVAIIMTEIQQRLVLALETAAYTACSKRINQSWDEVQEHNSKTITPIISNIKRFHDKYSNEKKKENNIDIDLSIPFNRYRTSSQRRLIRSFSSSAKRRKKQNTHKHILESKKEDKLLNATTVAATDDTVGEAESSWSQDDENGVTDDSKNDDYDNLNAYWRTEEVLTSLDRIAKFVDHLNALCDTTERSLLKTLPQRLTDFVFATTVSSEKVSRKMTKSLEMATEELRKGLRLLTEEEHFPFAYMVPHHSNNNGSYTTIITGLDWEGSYILPSAHFPLLLGVTVEPFYHQRDTEDECILSHMSKNPSLNDDSDETSELPCAFVTKVHLLNLQRHSTPASLQFYVKNDYFAAFSSMSKQLKEDNSCKKKPNVEYQYLFRGAVAGEVLQTGECICKPGGNLVSSESRVPDGDEESHVSPCLTFECNNGCPPKTLKLHLYEYALVKNESTSSLFRKSHTEGSIGNFFHKKYIGESFIPLGDVWKRHLSSIKSESIASDVFSATVTCYAQVNASEFDVEFDSDGAVVKCDQKPQLFAELELRITTKSIPRRVSSNSPSPYSCAPCTRHLLYKHGDDLRQELLALQFIGQVHNILKCNGLNLRLKNFGCSPVDCKRGFIEWVYGCVPLSKICDPSLHRIHNDIHCEHLMDTVIEKHSHPGNNHDLTGLDTDEKLPLVSDSSSSSHSTHRSSNDVDYSENISDPRSSSRYKKKSSKEWLRFEFMPRPAYYPQSHNGRSANSMNPVQEFLRNAAYDYNAPYYIRKDIMDNYVRSCAGYCIATYLLGVGDRHLDNIMLSSVTGQLIHCDFSFILGRDPKMYIPMRLSEEMVLGMGGRGGLNYDKFVSYVGAAFNILRRPTNFRSLLSLVRLSTCSSIPDISIHQSAEDALLALRYRFHLNSSDDDAITFIECLVESCLENKLWIAVDAMHLLGKHF